MNQSTTVLNSAWNGLSKSMFMLSKSMPPMGGGAKIGREMLNLYTAFVRFSLILRIQVQSYFCSHLFDISLESLFKDKFTTV